MTNTSIIVETTSVELPFTRANFLIMKNIGNFPISIRLGEEGPAIPDQGIVLGAGEVISFESTIQHISTSRAIAEGGQSKLSLTFA